MSRHRPGRGLDIVPLPGGRRAVLDLLDHARRVPVIHGMLEVDVTSARRRLVDHPSGGTLTAFVVASVARAVTHHPEVNVRRAGRQVIRFDTVDVVVTAEERRDGASFPRPHVFRDLANRRFDEVATELATLRPASSRGGAAAVRERTLLERLPSFVRRLAVRLASRFPASAARFGPAIGVSSLGMFGTGLAWGVPVSPLTLMVTVGAIGTRPALEDGALVEREVLGLTLSFDHTVVDGAPAARFATTLRELLERATVLDTR